MGGDDMGYVRARPGIGEAFNSEQMYLLLRAGKRCRAFLATLNFCDPGPGKTLI